MASIRTRYLAHVVANSVIALAALATVFWLVLWLESNVWAPIAIWWPAAGFLLWTVLLLATVVHPKLLEEKSEALRRQGGLWMQFLLLPVFYFGLFVLFARGVHNVVGPTWFAELPARVSLWTWLLYGLDNVIRAIVFDFAEIYGWSISHVEHAQNPIASTAVFLFRTTLSLALVRAVLTGLRKSGPPDPGEDDESSEDEGGEADHRRDPAT